MSIINLYDLLSVLYHFWFIGITQKKSFWLGDLPSTERRNTYVGLDKEIKLKRRILRILTSNLGIYQISKFN